MATSEAQIVKLVVTILKMAKEELDSRVVNGRVTLSRIRSYFVRLAFMSRSYEITSSYVTLGLATTLLDTFLTNRLQKLAPKEILSEKYDLPSSIREMLARELGGLATKHFDTDYVLKFDELKKDLTTFGNLENADEISKTTILNKVTNAIFGLVSVCSSEVVEEINAKVSLFLKETIRALENEPSFSRLEKEISLFVAGLHKEIYGWPFGEK